MTHDTILRSPGRTGPGTSPRHDGTDRPCPPAWRAFGLLAGIGATLMAGCASVSPDGGFDQVQQLTRQHLGQEVRWIRSADQRPALDARVAELLANPLTLEDAVQVALLNNRELQASFADLGVAEADLVSTSRLPNPGFTFARLSRGDEVEFERGFSLGLVKLLTLPWARRLEKERFAQARQLAAQAVLRLAADTRKAYFVAVAAEQTVHYRKQVHSLADAAADLAGRMARVGNWSALQQAREQGFHADAALELARAEQSQTAARERLTRLMGLWGPQVGFTLPERLPDLPPSADELPDAEQLAMTQRLDIQAARQGVAQLARNLGLTRATRVVNVLELGVAHNSSSSQPTQKGYEITLELPLFDGGSARMAKAEAQYQQAVDRTAQLAIEARSQVREAYRVYRGSFEIARHYRDEIVPLKKRISEENQLRYNGMLIGVFELLADARSQIDSVNGYIQAQRDVWIARADLDLALTAGLPPLAPPSGAMSTLAPNVAAPGGH